MVHALERARRRLRPDCPLVLIQPHQHRRPAIAVATRGRRTPVAQLDNAVFQPLIDAANASIRKVIADGLFEARGAIHGRYTAGLESLAELDRFLHLTETPPRFPPGGRQRLLDLWRRRARGARIEVTQFFTVFGLRAATAPGTAASSRP